MIDINNLKLEQLDSVPVSKLSAAPELSAVYLALDPENCVHYVGQSVNLRQRLASHHLKQVFPVVGVNRIGYIPLDKEQLSDVEASLIFRFRPVYNENAAYGDIRCDRLHPKVPKKMIVELGCYEQQVIENLMDCFGMPAREAIRMIFTSAPDLTKNIKLNKLLNSELADRLSDEELMELRLL